MMPLVLIILVGVVVSGSATTVSTNGNLYTNVCVDDKLFSQDVIFDQPATSAQHCAALCKLQEGCVTFTFDQEICRGHTVLVTPSTSSTPAPGARSFTKESGRAAVIETTTEITTLAETTPEITTLAETTPEITTFAETTSEITTLAETATQANWLLDECSSDSQCTDTVANARCFVNQCMCIQGYFYSVSSKACIETCSSLDNTYLDYVSSAIHGNNIRVTSGVTVQQCLDDCNADGACLNVEYYIVQNKCQVQHITARENPLDWTETYSEWNFYQRNCQ